MTSATITRHYTVADVSVMVKVKPETVLGWIKAGELVASDLGSKKRNKKPRWRILESDWLAFWASRSTAATITPPAPRHRRAAMVGVKDYY